MYRLIVIIFKYKNKYNINQVLTAFTLASIMNSKKTEQTIAESGIEGLQDEINLMDNDVIVSPTVFMAGLNYSKLIKHIRQYMQMANMNMELEIYFPDVRTGERRLLRFSVTELLSKNLGELLQPVNDYLRKGKYLDRKTLAQQFFKGAPPGMQTNFADNLERGDLIFTEKTYDKD